MIHLGRFFDGKQTGKKPERSSKNPKTAITAPCFMLHMQQARISRKEKGIFSLNNQQEWILSFQPNQ
jgi:hypothetical protein